LKNPGAFKRKKCIGGNKDQHDPDHLNEDLLAEKNAERERLDWEK